MVQYRFTGSQGTGESVLERLETPCAGELAIGELVSDVLARGEFDLHVWASDPDAGGLEPSLKVSYESHERPPKALKVVLEWPEREDAPPATFEALMAIPCEGQLQGDDSDQG